jgi:hypothetical protein
MTARVLIVVLLMGAVAVGCGDPSSSASPVAVQASTAVSSPAPSDTATPTDVPSTEDSSTTTPEEGETGEPTDKPAVLPPEAANKPLPLSSIFKYPDGWRDGRYDVADRKQATGIGGELRDCGDSYTQTLELRLANNFTRFKLEFGESNSSESSDQILQVDANGQYRDQKTVKLNQIAAFDLDVAKVNALKIIVSLKESDACYTNSGAVEAVLMNLVLS